MLESVTDEWIEVAYTGGDPGLPDGPRVEVRVVGVARTPGIDPVSADEGSWPMGSRCSPVT